MRLSKNLGISTKFLGLSITLFTLSVSLGCYMLLSFDSAEQWDKVVAHIGGNAARTARVLSQQKLTSKTLDAPETASLARQILSLVGSDPSVRCAGLRLAGNQDNGLPVTRHTRALLCKPPSPPETSLLITFPVRGSDLAVELYIHDEAVRQESLVRSVLVLTVSALAILLSVISTIVAFRVIIGHRLRRLRSAMARVRETGKRQSIDPGPKDEIGTLVGEYNNLVLAEAERAEKLEAAIEQEMITQEKLAAANNELTHWINTGQSERRFQDFASASSDFFWELDSDRKFIYVSEHFAEITGVSEELVLGTRIDEWSENSDHTDGQKALLSALRAQAPFRDIDIPLPGQGDESRWVRLNGIPVRDASGLMTVFRGTGRDSTDDLRSKRAIHKAAFFDHVTGLPNRSLLLQHLEKVAASSVRYGRLFAVLFLDLDNFKIINDTWGHSAGDDFLKTIAERLTSTLRPSDLSGRLVADDDEAADDGDLIARLGGDEFVVVLTDLSDAMQARRVAERIAGKIQKTIPVGNVEMRCSASIGISVGPNDGESLEDLLKHADAAMYRAKSIERGSIQFFTTEIEEKTVARSNIERRLRTAINEGALSLHFQPRLSLKTGLPLSAEALLRWTDEELGSVPPDQFIPIAEESLLMVEIGEWVLDQAISTLAAWQNTALSGLSISVNLSAVQARDRNLANFIASLLSAHRVPGDQLELELTERVLMGETEENLALLQRFRDWNIQISLDDFGTGFSSMRQLRLFPISTLKVDKSFVGGLGENHSDESIVSAIVGLAHSLGLNSVAEGVETELQARHLNNLGCAEAQGYFYSKPVPKEIFEDWCVRRLSGEGSSDATLR